MFFLNQLSLQSERWEGQETDLVPWLKLGEQLQLKVTYQVPEYSSHLDVNRLAKRQRRAFELTLEGFIHSLDEARALADLLKRDMPVLRQIDCVRGDNLWSWNAKYIPAFVPHQPEALLALLCSEGTDGRILWRQGQEALGRDWQQDEIWPLLDQLVVGASTRLARLMQERSPKDFESGAHPVRMGHLLRGTEDELVQTRGLGRRAQTLVELKQLVAEGTGLPLNAAVMARWAAPGTQWRATLEEWRENHEKFLDTLQKFRGVSAT